MIGPDDPLHDLIRRHRCPGCDHLSLELRIMPLVSPLGVDVEWPHVVCTTEHCGWSQAATRVDN